MPGDPGNTYRYKILSLNKMSISTAEVEIVCYNAALPCLQTNVDFFYFYGVLKACSQRQVFFEILTKMDNPEITILDFCRD